MASKKRTQVDMAQSADDEEQQSLAGKEKTVKGKQKQTAGRNKAASSKEREENEQSIAAGNSQEEQVMTAKKKKSSSKNRVDAETQVEVMPEIEEQMEDIDKEEGIDEGETEVEFEEDSYDEEIMLAPVIRKAMKGSKQLMDHNRKENARINKRVIPTQAVKRKFGDDVRNNICRQQGAKRNKIEGRKNIEWETDQETTEDEENFCQEQSENYFKKEPVGLPEF